MVQVPDPDAVPDAPLADQVTTTGFFPPLVVPPRLIEDEVVVAGVGVIESVNWLEGVGVGVGLGADGGVEVCGAYMA